MKTPYQILGVASDASDADIKQAYLRNVKDNPPDSDPERFQSIHNAYMSVKDAKSRMSLALFDMPDTDFDALLDRALGSAESVQIKPEQFIKLLRAGITDTTFLNALAKSEKS